MKGLYKILICMMGVVPSLAQADDYPQDEYFKEFDQSGSEFFVKQPKVNDFWGTWEPNYDAYVLNEEIRLTPKNNGEAWSLLAPDGEKRTSHVGGVDSQMEIKKVENKFYLSGKKLSARAGDLFTCKITNSKSLMICRSPCGKYFKVFERGSLDDLNE